MKSVIIIILLSNFESLFQWDILTCFNIYVILYELKCSYPSVGEDLIIARIKKTQRTREAGGRISAGDKSKKNESLRMFLNYILLRVHNM